MKTMFQLISKARNQMAKHPEKNFYVFKNLVWLHDMHQFGKYRDETLRQEICQLSLYWSGNEEEEFPALKTLRTISFLT